MHTQAEIDQFVSSTQHLTTPDLDNFDGAFESAFEQHYPGRKKHAVSYATDLHYEDEVFEVDGKLVAWVNWHFHTWYVLPATKEKD